MKLRGYVEYMHKGQFCRADAIDGAIIRLRDQWVTVSKGPGQGSLLVGWDMVTALGGWSPVEVSR